jgi:hypothetical protein
MGEATTLFRCQVCQQLVGGGGAAEHAESHRPELVRRYVEQLGGMAPEDRAEIVRNFCSVCGWARGDHAPTCSTRVP